MFKRLKESWADLKRGTPGSRFEDQYDEQRKDKKKGAIGRVLRIIGGLVLIPVGVFFLAVPGPGLLVIAVGAVLIAREFKFAARFLDTVEVQTRRALKWVQGRWRRLVKARRAVIR
jgi:hypothetical protein